MPRGRKPKEPSNSVNLSGTLPPDTANGLVPLIDDMIREPGRKHRAVVEFYAQNRRIDTDTDTWQVVVRFSQIEPVTGAADETASKLLAEAQGARLGMMQFDDPASPSEDAAAG